MEVLVLRVIRSADGHTDAQTIRDILAQEVETTLKNLEHKHDFKLIEVQPDGTVDLTHGGWTVAGGLGPYRSEVKRRMNRS